MAKVTQHRDLQLGLLSSRSMLQSTGSQLGATLSPRGHVAVSGDISGCHN